MPPDGYEGQASQPLESRRDDALSALLDQEMRQSLAYMSGELSNEREQALKYYYGEPFGNEEDGHSRVVMRDVQDVVEWVLPALLKIFAGSDLVVEFQGRQPGDEEAAKQRTEYINYVFQADNPGFLLLYTAIKDALIQKNGVCKVYYDPSALDETRTVRGIDDDAYTVMLDDPDIEIQAHSEYPDESAAALTADAPIDNPSAIAAGPSGPEAGAAGPEAALMGAQDASQVAPTPMPAPMLHDVKYRKSGGKVCVEPVAPEEFLISRRARDIANSPYVGDRRRKTLSDLIAEGLVTAEEALALGGDDRPDLNDEAETRRRIDDEGDPELADREGVMREIWVTDHYVLVDYDQDGVAERRRVITAGSTRNILLNEEWEGPPPYASGSPILVTHRVIGQSLADQVMDLQLIKSTLMRQVLDNLYRTNNPRTFLTDDVNLDDYLNPQPGGYVRTSRNPNESVREAIVPFTAGASLPVMEYLEQVRENRTGVTRYNQGIDANSLNKTATGINQIMSAAQQRIELIARILAETFVKPLFALIDHCVTKHQDKARVIRIRGEWVSVDPRQWESNFDMTINVGLGTGNKDQMLMHLQNILGIQAQAIQLQGGANGPLVTMENIYKTCIKLTENAGLKNADEFWTDPAKAPPQEPQPDPEMAKVQQQAEVDKAKLQLQAQNDQAKMDLEVQKAQAETQIKLTEMNANLELQREKHANDMRMAQEKQAADQDTARMKMAGDQAMAREKQQGDSQLARDKAAGDHQVKREGQQMDADLRASEAEEDSKLAKRLGAIEKALKAISAKLEARG